MDGKKEIRKRIKAERKALSDEWIRLESARAILRLTEMAQYREAAVIFPYVGCKGEVETKGLIEKALKDGKTVAVPRVDGETMVFFEITSLDVLAPGAMDIPEPQEGLPVEDPDALMIMPGLAFDRCGRRIGYGGGYYDRYLAAHPGIRTIALAFDFQIEERIASEETDIPVDAIVTPAQVIDCAAYRRMEQYGIRSLAVKNTVAGLSSDTKNGVLRKAAKALTDYSEEILKANALDVEKAKERGMKSALLDRLSLTKSRIEGIAEGMLQVAALPDPIGEISEMKLRPNGLSIGKMRTPLGVIGIIYEARPNVTADVFALCFKAGNVTILRGGSDAIFSNKTIVEILRGVLKEEGVPEDALQLITDTGRSSAKILMQMNGFIDVLIPRGGAGLIRSVVRDSTVPVIETGTGNCHIYVDEGADVAKAVEIIFNAKTQRIGVCNAMESLVVHKSMLPQFLPALEEKLAEKAVELRADERSIAFLKHAVPATEEDFGTEYLDYILSVKTVDSLEEAIRHINHYSTGHSESILTKDYAHAQQFLHKIDSAAVYVNASTRFTDGFEFGLGAEIGISTQKLHARGPMGLTALTSEKYIIYGNGQVRA